MVAGKPVETAMQVANSLADVLEQLLSTDGRFVLVVVKDGAVGISSNYEPMDNIPAILDQASKNVAAGLKSVPRGGNQ